MDTDKRKFLIYGTNFFTPSIAHILNDITSKVKEPLNSAISSVKSFVKPGSATQDTVNVASDTLTAGREVADKGVLDFLGDAANPYGAIIYGGLSLAKGVSDRIRDSKYIRLAELGGAGIYGLQSVADALAIANGDYSALANLAFDVSMASELYRDTKTAYANNDVVDDVFGIGNGMGSLIEKVISLREQSLGEEGDLEEGTFENEQGAPREEDLWEELGKE